MNLVDYYKFQSMLRLRSWIRVQSIPLIKYRMYEINHNYLQDLIIWPKNEFWKCNQLFDVLLNIDIDVNDMYVWICACTENLHELDHVWYIDHMIGNWKSISMRNRYCMCYLDGWCVCDVLYVYRVYFYACMKEGVVRELVGVKDDGWWVDRIIDGVIGEVIGGVIDGG